MEALNTAQSTSSPEREAITPERPSNSNRAPGAPTKRQSHHQHESESDYFNRLCSGSSIFGNTTEVTMSLNSLSLQTPHQSLQQ